MTLCPTPGCHREAGHSQPTHRHVSWRMDAENGSRALDPIYWSDADDIVEVQRAANRRK